MELSQAFELVGNVISGRGNAVADIGSNAEELKSKLGEGLIHGTLNIVLPRPLRFNDKNAVIFDKGNRFLWSASLNGVPVWLYRWRGAPLHVVELISHVPLRNKFGLRDGDEVRLQMQQDDISPTSFLARLAWSAAWFGRRRWFYMNGKYHIVAVRLCTAFGATQATSSVFARVVDMSWRLIKRTPLLGPVAVRVKNLVYGSTGNFQQMYVFERLPIDSSQDVETQSRTKVQNLLNYTKLSDTSYSALLFPAGYHSIELAGHFLQGQRNPAKRLDTTNIDFHGKTVLDLGCNQGGMLFHLDGLIKWGVGVDYDSRMVNAANRIKTVRQSDRLQFYVFDLEKEPLELIEDFLPEPKADVVFLLSVCMWLKNWQEVIDFGTRIAESMLFETNGTPEQQAAQEGRLNKVYRSVAILSESSVDDPQQKERKLFYCCDAIL